MTTSPETIEHRWDILYRDYPEIYDAFSSFPHNPGAEDVVNRNFPLAGKVVVDGGSGNGKSTFALAVYAAHVFGVEPEAAMRAIAEQRLRELELTNVSFVAGHAEALPFADESVDVVTTFTAPIDVPEALRVLKPGGLLIHVEIAPDWYGGELTTIINHPTPDLAERSQQLIEEWGCSYLDFDAVQEYGSTDNIIRTYGLIFGRNAIDYLKQTGKTSIRWRLRIHYRSR
jgi:ubiquinone/menaquinone biosynthesis C-methylase UbiE